MAIRAGAIDSRRARHRLRERARARVRDTSAVERLLAHALDSSARTPDSRATSARRAQALRRACGVVTYRDAGAVPAGAAVERAAKALGGGGKLGRAERVEFPACISQPSARPAPTRAPGSTAAPASATSSALTSGMPRWSRDDHAQAIGELSVGAGTLAASGRAARSAAAYALRLRARSMQDGNRERRECRSSRRRRMDPDDPRWHHFRARCLGRYSIVTLRASIT